MHLEFLIDELERSKFGVSLPNPRWSVIGVTFPAAPPLLAFRTTFRRLALLKVTQVTLFGKSIEDVTDAH